MDWVLDFPVCRRVEIREKEPGISDGKPQAEEAFKP